MRPRWNQWAAPSPRSFLQVRDHGRYRNSNDWWLGLTLRRARRRAAAAEGPHDGRLRVGEVLRPGTSQAHRLPPLPRRHRSRPRHLRLTRQRLPALRRPTPPHDKRAACCRTATPSTPRTTRSRTSSPRRSSTACSPRPSASTGGVPNLDSFIDPRAFIRLELEDFDADLGRDPRRHRRRRMVGAPSVHPSGEAAHPRGLPVLPHARPRDRPGAQAAALASSRDADRGRRSPDRRPAVRRRSSRSPTAPATRRRARRSTWSGASTGAGLCLEVDIDRVRAARGRPRLHRRGRRPRRRPSSTPWSATALADRDRLAEPGGRAPSALLGTAAASTPARSGRTSSRCSSRRRRSGAVQWSCSPPTGTSPRTPARTAQRRARAQRARRDRRRLPPLAPSPPGATCSPSRCVGCATPASPTPPAGSSRPSSGRSSRRARRALEEAFGRASADRRPLARTRRPSNDRSSSTHDGSVSTRCRWLAASGTCTPRVCPARTAGTRNVTDWRRLLEHFVIDRWHDCVAALGDHDACGVNWHRASGTALQWQLLVGDAPLRGRAAVSHRSGPLRSRGLDRREPAPVHCLHESGIDHYVTPYPETAYS